MKLQDKKAKICMIEGCNEFHLARGYCCKHYGRLKRHGNPLTYLIKINKCKVEGCDKRRARQGFCSLHYQRNKTYGTPFPDKLLRYISVSIHDGYENWVIRKDGCWGWSGWHNPAGYAYFSHKQKKYAAHRYSYEYYNGPIKQGMMVCHHCDNPECSNPTHLFLGTNSDNMKDCYMKGRRKNIPVECMPRGESCHLSKLKTEQIIEIKKMIQTGFTNTEIACLFPVTHKNISLIRNEKIWKHIFI